MKITHMGALVLLCLLIMSGFSVASETTGSRPCLTGNTENEPGGNSYMPSRVFSDPGGTSLLLIGFIDDEPSGSSIVSVGNEYGGTSCRMGFMVLSSPNSEIGGADTDIGTGT